MSLANEKYLIPDGQEVKELQPLPQGVTVMLECEGDNDAMLWRDYRETPCAVCLAVVEEGAAEGAVLAGTEVTDAGCGNAGRGKKRRTVRAYNLSTGEVLNDNSMIVQIQNCPKCGRPMRPLLNGYEIYDVLFRCECGICLEYWDNDWTVGRESVKPAYENPKS